jgi:hypothetical protein
VTTNAEGTQIRGAPAEPVQSVRGDEGRRDRLAYSHRITFDLPVVILRPLNDLARASTRRRWPRVGGWGVERGRRKLRASLAVRGRLYRGEQRGRLYREAPDWLGSGDVESLLTD